MAGALSSRPPNPATRFWESYCRSLQRRPILTKALTSVVGFALGDAVAQLSNRPSRGDARAASWKYDTYRTVRLALYGGAVAGPLGHYWFSFLDNRVYAQAPKSLKAIASKIFLDQTLMTPVGTTLFFSFTKLMDGQPDAIVPAVQDKLWPTVQASVKLWPAAHAINFAFIPSAQRLLYINVISIFWTMILSKASAETGQVSHSIAFPGLVLVPVLEGETETLASVGFLDEMEALEAEYDRD